MISKRRANSILPFTSTTRRLGGPLLQSPAEWWQGSTNGAFEWAYGVSDWFEAGAYLPVFTLTRSGQLLLDGAKVRALFAVPNAGARRFFYGVNFEFSRNPVFGISPATGARFDR